MAPKLNKKESSLEGMDHKRKSGVSNDVKARKKDKGKIVYGLRERELKHVKILSVKELYDAYTFGKEIGKGTFGTVMAVVDKETKRSWALKIISKPSAGKQIKYVLNELRILKMVDHPHIIHLEKVFETDRRIYLVLERCIGELAGLLTERGRLVECDSRKVLNELCDAVAYLHKYDIVHRDLKLENILLALNPRDREDGLFVKVADFGLSTVKKGVAYTDMLREHCGTLMYMSPEMMTGSNYSQQCDIWSMGVILYLLLSGRYPFFSTDEEKLIRVVCTAEVDYDFIPEDVSFEAKDLISKMLAINPAVRLTASEVLQHPWTTGNVMSGAQGPANVLEMMRLWRSEMKVTSEDWLAAVNVPTKPLSEMSMPKKPGPPAVILEEVDETDASSQFLEIPKTDIRFDRNARKRSKDKLKHKEDDNASHGKESRQSDFSEFTI